MHIGKLVSNQNEDRTNNKMTVSMINDIYFRMIFWHSIYLKFTKSLRIQRVTSFPLGDNKNPLSHKWIRCPVDFRDAD